MIIGSGGFGREVLDVISAMNATSDHWEFLGFAADDEPSSEMLSRLGARWLGPVADVLSMVETANYAIGVGDPSTRKALAGLADRAGLSPATLIHPSATIGSDVQVGAGTVVCSHVSITSNIRLGRHVHVNLNSTIGHDCRIADYVTINPLVAVSGDVVLDEGVTMGTHSSILQGLSVGSGSFVGAGAVVTKNVPAGATVVGVPARPLA